MRWINLVLALVTLAAYCAASAAEEAKSVRITTQGKSIAEPQKKPVKSASAASSKRFFKDRNGTIILTNRPEKYADRTDCIEVQIHYDPIVIPNRYKKLKSPAQYTTSNISQLVESFARIYGVDKNLVYAVIKAESNFDPAAVSTSGARGLMQLMPFTAAEMGVVNIFDPAQNIAGGTQYLAKMLQLFNNNLSLALAGYNAGPGAVKMYGGIPPYAETQNYVKAVSRYYAGFSNSSLRPMYVAAAKIPRAGYLPHQEKPVAEAKAIAKTYTIRFHSGYTQPADKVIDQDPYYSVTYGERTTLIRKDFVKDIVKPA